MDGLILWFKNLIDFMTVKEWIGVVIIMVALVLAMTSTSMTKRVVKRRRRRQTPSTTLTEREQAGATLEEPSPSVNEQATTEDEPFLAIEASSQGSEADDEIIASLAESDITAQTVTAPKPFRPKRQAAVETADPPRSSGGRRRRDDIASLTGGGDPADAKLNLARAYIDIGDIKEAKQMLEEVLKEGSEPQQQAAQLCLNKLTNTPSDM